MFFVYTQKNTKIIEKFTQKTKRIIFELVESIICGLLNLLLLNFSVAISVSD